MIFDKQAHLGLIKVLTKRTTSVLVNILQVALARSVDQSPQISGQLLQATTDTIDLVFSDDETDYCYEKND